MRIVKGLLVACLSAMMALQAQAATLGEAIDKAGQQRMLSQRVANSYLLVLIQPESTKGRDRMRRAIAQFEANAALLSTFSPAAPIALQLHKVMLQWQSYKQLAEAPASLSNAESLLRQSDDLLVSAHGYVQALEALSGSKSGELVNIAGRQRMLSQRIAKNYFSYFLSLGGDERIHALYADLAEYEAVLELLQASELNTEAVTLKLRRVAGQFIYAKKGFDGLMALTGDRLIFVITGTTDAMLKNMDDVTKLYAAL